MEKLAISKKLDPLGAVGHLSGRVYVDTYRPDEAIRVLRQEIDLVPGLDLAQQLLAYVYARTGDEAEARRVLSGVLRRGEQSLDLLGFHLVMSHAGLGNSDETFRWLEAARVQHASFTNLLGVAAGFESVRADPRFENILRRMGLRQIAGVQGEG